MSLKSQQTSNEKFKSEAGNSEETCDNTQPPRLIPEDASLSTIFSCSHAK